MGKKKPEVMEALKATFPAKVCAEHGENRREARPSKMYELVLRFADYGFNKSHAAAYALVSFQTAYLKAHFPAEFYAAMMNAEIGSDAKSSKMGSLRAEAVRRGFEVAPPCVNRSGARFTGVGRKVEFALSALRGVGRAAAEGVVKAREAGGAFAGLGDFARRVDLTELKRIGVENLAWSGAFDALEPNRRRVAEAAEALVRFSAGHHREKESLPLSLFDDSDVEAAEPALPEVTDYDLSERLEQERRSIGFLISGHPLDAFAGTLMRRRTSFASQLRADRHEGEAVVAAVVKSLVWARSRSNRSFARMQISDPDGDETVMVTERAFETCGEFLKPSSAVLLTVDAKVDERGFSLFLRSARRLERVDATPAERRPKAVRIFVDSAATAKRIQPILQGARAANGRDGLQSVRLAFDLPDRPMRAELALADRYDLHGDAMAALEEVAGVRVVAIEERP